MQRSRYHDAIFLEKPSLIVAEPELKVLVKSFSRSPPAKKRKKSDESEQKKSDDSDVRISDLEPLTVLCSQSPDTGRNAHDEELCSNGSLA